MNGKIRLQNLIQNISLILLASEISLGIMVTLLAAIKEIVHRLGLFTKSKLHKLIIL